MSFKNVIGQDHAIGLIKNALKKNRMPQSWLFTGQKSIGKFKTALALSKNLNCKNFTEDSCGECENCVQIEKQIFMDFRVVSPEGKNIKISQIKQSLDWLHLHSDQALIRVMIVDEAHKLGREAANAFLKTLEEPTPNTLLILIAESYKLISETIVSRCQQIRFKPLSSVNTKQILNQNTNLTNEKINFLIPFSMGSINTKLASKNEQVKNIQNMIINWMTNLSSINLDEILKYCEKWSKSDDDEWCIALDFLETWFRDLSFLNSGIPEIELINNFESNEGKRIYSLKESALFFKIEHVQEIFWEIVKARKNIDLNGNKTLIMSGLFLNIYGRKS